jgi:hypothetical protein
VTAIRQRHYTGALPSPLNMQAHMQRDPSTQSDPRVDESSHSSSKGSDGNERSTGPRGAASLQRLSVLIAELKEYANYYLTARVDSVKFRVRSGIIYAALGIAAALAFLTFVGTAVVLLMQGLSVGLGNLFGSRLHWLGGVILGIVALGAIGAAGYIALRRLQTSSRRKLVQKYEQRQHWQRSQFGRNVREAARGQQAQK